MSFIAVALYDLGGTFLGYAIKNTEVPKLQSTNVYVEGEEAKLNEQLARLNEDIDLRQYWPNPKDPDVEALLADETFVPIEYEMAEVVDDDHSLYVWKQEPEYDPLTGQPTGAMVDGSELDEMASVINYKMARVPKRPSDVMWRIKKACEQIARQRAGMLS